MVQYKLEKSQNEQLIEALDNGLYTRTYNELDDLNIMYLKPYPVLQVFFF
jgi:hypothetical protein